MVGFLLAYRKLYSTTLLLYFYEYALSTFPMSERIQIPIYEEMADGAFHMLREKEVISCSLLITYSFIICFHWIEHSPKFYSCCNIHVIPAQALHKLYSYRLKWQSCCIFFFPCKTTAANTIKSTHHFQGANVVIMFSQSGYKSTGSYLINTEDNQFLSAVTSCENIKVGN